ncbi:MAG: HlyD family efflux transporter periplasmic adaptor subunit [Ignavibacteriales bacterium]|nr:MAG: HlyD family efflux transporter periplasmic adaptor subunit [Ignavibacteriales bacterium]
MDKQIEKKRFTPKKIAAISAAVLFVFFILYVFLLSDQSSKLNVERERITISTVQRGSFHDYIPVTGEVMPIETFFLDVVEGGRVIQKFVEEGAILKAGDPIIKLENVNLTLQTIYNQTQVVQQENNLRSYRLTLEQNKLNLQTQILNLNNQIKNQQRVYETNKQLYEKSLISKIEFENSRDQYDYLLKSRDLSIQSFKLDSLSRDEQIKQLETTLKQFQKNMKLIEDQFSNLLVRAPINGQLTALNAEIGKSIAGGQNIGQIDNTEAYKVRVDIDEHYIARVREGQVGECTFDDKTYKLEIKRVFVQVTNGRFQADMHFIGEAPKGIRRGQTFHIKLELGGLSDALLVDAGGFYQTTGGQWIFVVDKSGGFAVRRPIKIGRQNPQYYEVLEGLRPGEKVITSSYDNYNDYDKLVLQ